jgi:hypothetical protein
MEEHEGAPRRGLKIRSLDLEPRTTLISKPISNVKAESFLDMYNTILRNIVCQHVIVNHLKQS